MELAQALDILGALADGCDPLTGQALAAGHLCQHPQVVRALCCAVQELRRRGAAAPPRPTEAKGAPYTENAGKPWTPQEEAELARVEGAGATIGQLAVRHGRTRQAIQGRLYRLGRVPTWRPGGQHRSAPQSASQAAAGPDRDGIQPKRIT